MFASFFFCPYESESLMALRGITLLKVITLEMTGHENYIFRVLRGNTTNQQFCVLVRHCSVGGRGWNVFSNKNLEEFTMKRWSQKEMEKSIIQEEGTRTHNKGVQCRKQ